MRTVHSNANGILTSDYVLSSLGQGGFGEVLKCYNEQYGLCAVKVFKKGTPANELEILSLLAEYDPDGM